MPEGNRSSVSEPLNLFWSKGVIRMITFSNGNTFKFNEDYGRSMIILCPPPIIPPILPPISPPISPPIPPPKYDDIFHNPVSEEMSKPGINVIDAIFHRERCIGNRANQLWHQGGCRSETAESDWLQAEAEVLGTVVNLIVCTENEKFNWGRVDKTNCVRDVVHHEIHGPTLKDKSGATYLILNKRNSFSSHVAGIKIFK
jgi:hypothetical protein